MQQQGTCIAVPRYVICGTRQVVTLPVRVLQDVKARLEGAQWLAQCTNVHFSLLLHAFLSKYKYSAHAADLTEQPHGRLLGIC
jgi:hypothetical protein